MYSRMEKNHGQKVQRFSIRKYSFGAASVAVAAYMMFGGAGQQLFRRMLKLHQRRHLIHKQSQMQVIKQIQPCL